MFIRSNTRIAMWGILILTLFTGCGKTGGTATSDLLEITRISPDGADAAEPAIAADGSGNVYVAYVEHLPQKRADIFIQRLDADRKRVGERVRVNPDAGSATAWRGDPPTIAIGAGNTIYIGWTRRLDDENAKGNDLMLSASGDGGNSFTAPVKVNDDEKPASHGMHSLDVDRTGRIYLAWLDERNIRAVQPPAGPKPAPADHHEEVEPNSEVFYSVSSNGGKTFSVNKKIAADVCPCCKTSLLTANDGGVYVAWRQVLEGDHRHIAVAHLNSDAATYSAGVVVSDDKWQINACPVSGAALSSPGNGLLDVLWYTAGSAGQAGLYLARSRDNGKSFEPRLLVSNEATGGTPVLLTRNDKRPIAIFAGVDNKIVSASWQDVPANGLEQAAITDGSLPAAAASNGKLFAAFVRMTDKTSSVWLASR